MSSAKPRTIVYIDGFNLYYGALKGTKFKWLDLQTLFHKLLGEHHTITEIKYFTVRVSAREGDPDAPNRQDAYLNALQAHIPNINIYYGHFLTNLVKAKVSNPSKGCPNIVTIILDSAVEMIKIISSPYLPMILIKWSIHPFGECLIFIKFNASRG
jgi:hypothetical protein